MKDLQKLKHIGIKGRGYFCLVKLYVDETSSEQYAVKVLKKEHYPNKDYRSRLKREIKLLQELKGCKNIVELSGYGEDTAAEFLWYSMPFAEWNLFDFIRKHNNTLTKKERYIIIEQVIKAIKYAHERNILHRDISPNNVLVFNNDKEITIKVSDFGLGKDTESLSHNTGSSISGYGQILYVAPEQRKQLKDATYKSDIYSLGKLIYFVFTGKDPDNFKAFELSTLVNRATEDDANKRYATIAELEDHFFALRDIMLDHPVSLDVITLKELVADSPINLTLLHQVILRGNYHTHVYTDFIAPFNTYMLTDNNLSNYYKLVGTGIRETISVYASRLNECFQGFGWPFDQTETFGRVFKRIILTVNDDESKLIAFKMIWDLAFIRDQWAVQRMVKELFTSAYIPSSIEAQLSEYIILQETKSELKHFALSSLPRSVKASIIKNNENVARKEEEQKNTQDNEIDLT